MEGQTRPSEIHRASDHPLSPGLGRRLLKTLLVGAHGEGSHCRASHLDLGPSPLMGKGVGAGVQFLVTSRQISYALHNMGAKSKADLALA